jgi:hypothetical protein
MPSLLDSFGSLHLLRVADVSRQDFELNPTTRNLYASANSEVEVRGEMSERPTARKR